jgi:hypothetical protein
MELAVSEIRDILNLKFKMANIITKPNIYPKPLPTVVSDGGFTRLFTILYFRLIFHH